MNNSLIAIDLAKNIFQVCVVNSNNQVLLNRQLTRTSLSEFIANQAPTTVAMEVCYSSHYWARLFQSYGHQVKLIPAQHVKPFLRGNKNNHNDALAIAGAACRPNIRPVPIKTVAQQDIQALHRLRERMVSQRTSLFNQTRGLLNEYGIFFPNGFKALRQTLVDLLDPSDNGLSVTLKYQLQYIADEFNTITTRINELNQLLAKIAQDNPLCRYLMSIPGIGCINATALFSAIGNGSQFNAARELSVWLVDTPKHYTSGNKHVMGGY